MIDQGLDVGSSKLVKETLYDTTLTVAGPTDLADMTGSVLMTDGSTEASGAYNQTPYKLVTTDIESLSAVDADGYPTGTFGVWVESAGLQVDAFEFTAPHNYDDRYTEYTKPSGPTEHLTTHFDFGEACSCYLESRLCQSQLF